MQNIMQIRRKSEFQKMMDRLLSSWPERNILGKLFTECSRSFFKIKEPKKKKKNWKNEREKTGEDWF